MNKSLYQRRRAALSSQLLPNSIAVLSAGRQLKRNGDASFRFRQDSTFYYLTGFNEPDAILVIYSGQEDKSILFLHPTDPMVQLWEGARLGPAAAPEVLGVEQAFALDSFDEYLPKLLSNCSQVYYPFSLISPALKECLMRSCLALKQKNRQGLTVPTAFYDLDPLLSEMRLFKSEEELACLRKAANISVDAHLRAMRACKNLHHEYELEAELSYEFYRQGCRGLAYDPIVAAGANACILHYTQNNAPLKAGELVLIDAAGEFENYAADITRTFPISGRFSEEQRQIYDLVLSAQQAGIACIKPGLPWDQIQKEIVQVLTQGLLDLGLLKGKYRHLLEQQAYSTMYMHQSGHWLGLDVHDAGVYKIKENWRPLQAGMVLTVEPGLYLRAGLPGIDKKWWDIGIRIEDDILVTESGYENLTERLPTKVNEIEALMCE